MDFVLSQSAFPIYGGVIACAAVFGAFGGLVNHHLAPTGDASRGRGAGVAATVGAAGAIGFVFFIISIGGVSTFSSVVEWLRLTSLSVLAGVGAPNLLPLMVSSLQKQITAANEAARTAQERAEAAVKQAVSAQREAEKVKGDYESLAANNQKLAADLENTRLVRDIELIISRFDEVPPAEHSRVVEGARRLIDDGRAAPHLFVGLGMYLKRRFHSDPHSDAPLREAIAVLERAKRSVAEAGDPRLRAFDYNIACYYGLIHGFSGAAGALEACLDHLRTSLERSDDVAADLRSIQEDKDFDAVRETPGFLALIEAFRAPRPAGEAPGGA